jgi:hypothetical protein
MCHALIKSLFIEFLQLFSQDLQKINSLINKEKTKAVAKRFNMDTDDYPPNKMSKELLLISDREEVHN